MLLYVNGLSAVRLIRTVRTDGNADLRTFRRCSLQGPNPEPSMRWTVRRVQSSPLAALDPNWQEKGLHVAVPNESMRLEARFAKNTIYKRGLPDDAFLDLGDGLRCASPELSFLEMARMMPRPVLVMFGHELCGTFSRDADDPRMGEVALSVPPATSVQQIRKFLSECRGILGLGAAREAIEQVANNAWSSMESVISTTMVLETTDLGYGLGPLELNNAQRVTSDLAAPEGHELRIPDIVVAGTPVGINYDGGDHLDFSDIEKAFASSDADALASAERALRGKGLDDMHRNRELTVSGMTVFPITKEDVFVPGALDQIMSSIVDAIERQSDKDVSATRALLASGSLKKERQYLIWSLYPWKNAAKYAQMLMARS